MEKILVIGGAGYIGGVTTNLLRAQGYDAVIFDNLMYEERFLKDVPFIRGDIRNTDLLLNIHEEYDHIIWLAAIVGDGACAQDPEFTHEINVSSLKRFLDACKRRIIFPSTCSVYGAQNGILSEESTPNPLSVYAQTKLLSEKIVLAHGGLVFRLGTLFGLGDQFSRLRLDLVVNLLTFRALAEKRITVFGGDQWRPILSVRDVAQYFVEAVKSDASDVFNLSYKNVRIIELADVFKKLFSDLTVETTEIKFEDARNYRVSTTKVEEAFDFRPSITVEEEIARVRDVLQEGRIKNPLDPRYYNTHHVSEIIHELKEFEKGESYVRNTGN